MIGLFVAGCATWLPPARTVGQALTAGETDDGLARTTATTAVRVSEAVSAPEMAARAARRALHRSGIDPDDVAIVLHASLYHQGHELWAPASYVQRVAVGNRCPAMEVRQVSNGGMAALELASAFLTAEPGRDAALVTTGDRLADSGFHRWRSDPGTVYADGGTAIVLSRTAGFARIRSLVTVSDPELEGMHREGDPFGTAPGDGPDVVDLGGCQRGFLTRAGRSFGVTRVAAGQKAALQGALEQAGVTLDRVTRVTLPHLGYRRLKAGYLGPLGLDERRTSWPWSRTVGHLGGGDPFAGLEHFVLAEELPPGSLCLLTSVGAGFSWSCAVLEVLERPDWAATPEAGLPAGPPEQAEFSEERDAG